MDITTVFGTVFPGSSPGGWTEKKEKGRESVLFLFFSFTKQGSKRGAHEVRLSAMADSGARRRGRGYVESASPAVLLEQLGEARTRSGDRAPGHRKTLEKNAMRSFLMAFVPGRGLEERRARPLTCTQVRG